MFAAFRFLRPRYAAPIAAAALAVSLVAGLLVPIYTDEITWRMQTTRSPFDGGVDRGLSENCGPLSAALRAPLLFQPMRHVSAWFALAAPDPRAVRVLGVALALIWVGLFWAIARRAAGPQAATARAIGLGLLGLGLTPLLLVWSRPEQAILLAMTCAILIALRDGGRLRVGNSLAAVAICLCGVMTLGYHPKAVVFLPVTIAAVACSGRGREGRVARILAIALLAYGGIAAWKYWNARLACPADPIVAAMFAKESAISAYKLLGWGPALAALAAHALPIGYIKQARPAIEHMSGWLPTIGFPLALLAAWRALVTSLWLGALLAGTAALLTRLLADGRARRIAPTTLLALAIALSVLAWGGLQLRKNPYELALVMPLLVLAVALLLPAAPPGWRAPLARIGAMIVAFGLVSQIMLLAIYVPPLARRASHPGTIADQPYSFVPWGYPAMRREILAAGRLCAIDPARARYLLVDDLTYFPYLRSAAPQNRMATLSVWAGTIRDPIAYLRARHSSGVIVQCAVLPAGLRAQAKSVGQFCCLGPLERGAS